MKTILTCGKTMTFFTNFYANQLWMYKELADRYGLVYEIRDDATDKFGNPRPDDLAFYVDESINGFEEKLENFQVGCSFVWQILTDAFVSAGVSKDECYDLDLYPGCEEEYWPGLKVDYQKAIDEF